MTSKEVDVLYGNITINLPVPATIEELDSLVGVGETLASAIDDISYRNTFPRLYKTVAEMYLKEGHKKAQATDKSGTPKTNKRKDGTETPILVSDLEFLGTLWESFDESDRTIMTARFEKAKSEIPFYEKGSGGGGGRISEAAMATANGLIAKGEDAITRAIEAIESRVPGLTIARDSDGNVGVESLARGIQALEKKMRAEAAKATAAALSV